MRHEKQTAPTGKTASARVLDLERMSLSQLEKVFVDGSMPDLSKLAGWEFRGLNSPSYFRLLGIKKFIKGFYRDGDDVFGYNCPAVQNKLTDPWIAKPTDDAPKRFGFYKVTPVDPTAKDNLYLHAALLDYGEGDNPKADPSRGLRDYLVQVDPDNDDLYLGKAYYAAGPLRVPTRSFFILERHRPGLQDVAFR